MTEPAIAASTTAKTCGRFISTVARRADALHPMAEKVAKAAGRLKPLEDSTVEEARALREERGNPFAPPGCDLASMSDLVIPSRAGKLSLRIYRPIPGGETLEGALVFFHGGGFVLGNVEQYDSLSQQLAYHSNCIVISVEYRLAPATKSAGIFADGFDAYAWVYTNAEELGIDKNRIALGGDSAGGNLTIAVLLNCKKNQFPMPAFQLLIYPATDWTMSATSIDEFAEGYFLTKKGMQWFRGHYLESPERAYDHDVSPLLSDLSGLPAAYVLTAGFDPLRDEGKAFADRLASFNVAVEHVCYTDMIHGFVSFAGGIAAGMIALEAMGSVLERALCIHKAA